MKTKAKKAPRGPKYASYDLVPKTYIELCNEWLPRPIHDDDANGAATVMIDALAGFTLNDEQEDYLEAVSHFVSEYEDDEDAMEKLPGIDFLRAIIEDNGLSGADLSRILGGSRLLGPMILRGERQITADHARALGAHFKIDPGLFL